LEKILLLRPLVLGDDYHTFGGLDGNTLTGTGDAFVTKYDSSGVKQ
jgi:hypothetical protein